MEEHRTWPNDFSHTGWREKEKAFTPGISFHAVHGEASALIVLNVELAGGVTK